MAVLILMYWPDTNGMPLEEVARLFGDEEELFGGHAGSGPVTSGVLEQGHGRKGDAGTSTSVSV